MTLQFDGTLVLVGAGKMGSALLEGFLEHGLKPDQVMVQDPAPSKPVVQRLKAHGITCSSVLALDTARPPLVILLAVKPQLLGQVMAPLASCIAADTLIMSVAAGQPLRVLEAGLGSTAAVVRAMPNTPASVGAGMTVCIANSKVSDDQRALTDALLGSVGDVAWIEDEALMDAVTAVSGSGPAYVFLLAETLADAGIAAGLAPKLAQQLARATVSGAGQMLAKSQLGPDDLRQAVTSPGGTTAAALEVLMDKDGLADLMVRAVAAAKKRSQDLAG